MFQPQGAITQSQDKPMMMTPYMNIMKSTDDLEADEGMIKPAVLSTPSSKKKGSVIPMM